MLETCPRCNTPWEQREFCPNDGTLRHTGVIIGDRYELDRLIGIGGMGHVFAGRHKLLGKGVAIKVLRPELSHDATQVARFLREAQLASQLHHENIVSITDFGRDAVTANLYLVMELLVGSSLSSTIAAEGPMPLERAILVLRQVCRSLSTAHHGGVVHRDLTPRNVFLTEQSGRKDFVKLLDFGISRLAGGEDRVTSTGIAVGTTAYMPPEQLRGEAEQDHRADLYALGVMAFEILTGGLPFKERTSALLIAEKLAGEPLDLTQTDLGRKHPGLAQLISECLSKDPSRRPASAAEVEQRLLASGSSEAGHTEDLSGMRAGSYRLVRLLGAGGIGSVWLGEHPVIGSKVAIKVLHPEFGEHAEAVRRFVTEAQAVNRMESPHIVKIFDFGKLADGRDYAVMELLEGQTLGEQLRKVGRLPWAETRAIAAQVLRALSVAHQAGVIHRDLKPDNIFLAGDPRAPQVKILDFGIAKLLAGEGSTAHKTQLGIGIGTPIYAAPEQAAGQAIGPAADIYALGVVLYEMLSGQPPFVGNVSEVLSGKMTAKLPSLSERAPGLDPRAAALVEAMLARDPAARPQAAEEILTRLEETPAVKESAGAPELPASRHTPTILWGSVSTPSVPAVESGAASAPSATPPYAGAPSERLSQEETRPRSAARRFLLGLSPRSRVMVAGSGLLLLLGLGAMGVALRGRTSQGVRSETPAASAHAPRPVVAEPIREEPASGAAQAATELRPSEDSPPPNPGRGVDERFKSRSRRVTLTSSPRGARVILQGKDIGQTPLSLELDPGLPSMEVELSKKGYRRARQQLTSGSKSPVTVRLDPVAGGWVDPFEPSRAPAKKATGSAPKRRPVLTNPFEE